MTSPDLAAKIVPGRRVRLRSGAEIRSFRGPSRPDVVKHSSRPYWVTVLLRKPTGDIVWRGSAKYFNSAKIDDVDRVEDLSDA